MAENSHLLKNNTSYEIDIISDLVYASPNGRELLADLYLPKNRNRPVPVIIWLHGGGWRFGDRKLGPDFSKYFASYGYAMVSIDYRLSGEATFPAPIHDVKTAIRWVKSIAEEYGINRKKIGLWGSSAGGHLAAFAAATGSSLFLGETPEYEEWSSEVQAVAVGYGPVDFLKIDEQKGVNGIIEGDPESVQISADKKSSDPDSFESLFIGAPIETCPDLVRKANPVTYVKQGLPPFLIMHGLSDVAVPAQQSELLYEAMVEKGNDVSLYLIEGLGHGFFNRTNLDDAGPRSVKYRSSHNGIEVSAEEISCLIFHTIEAFFRKTFER